MTRRSPPPTISARRPPRLRPDAGLEAAYMSYNHSADYVTEVLAWAHAYQAADADGLIPAPAPQPLYTLAPPTTTTTYRARFGVGSDVRVGTARSILHHHDHRPAGTTLHDARWLHDDHSRSLIGPPVSEIGAGPGRPHAPTPPSAPAWGCVGWSAHVPKDRDRADERPA